MDDGQSPGSKIPGYTPETLNVRYDLTEAQARAAVWPVGDFEARAYQGRDSFWIVVRRAGGGGGCALRCFPILGAYSCVEETIDAQGARWGFETHSGRIDVVFVITDSGAVRIRTSLTPAHDLLVAFWPRDMYAVDSEGDPKGAQGRVEAAQRGLNGGLCFASLSEPAFASVLYLQNLTALNRFFILTQTKPDGVVGGVWPELGFLPPAAPNGYSSPIHPLPAGETVTISDACIAFRSDCTANEVDSARDFIDMLAELYPLLDKPEPIYRDWPSRAGKTLTNLQTEPDATVRKNGALYVRPYLAAEYPDSMVQLSVLVTLREFERTHGHTHEFSDALAAGVPAFFDNNLKTLRRYLPDVGDDKDKDAIDSWYLYHPLMNLARLAVAGETWAETLFLDSLGFAIRAARHFDYRWPIQYRMTDFSVITQSRGSGSGELGQTDVGGLYAYVLLQAHQLTGEPRYIDEARAALKALEGRRFELAYQTNLTAWGAVACLKLWRLVEEERYLHQSLTFIASFLHNCELWDSHLGFVAKSASFFGVTCLHDGPYMAAYEAFEAFVAFDEYLQLGADDLPASVGLLVNAYWRYAQDVLWSFYPDTLPAEALALEVRNGRLDRNLSFPLEDIYGDCGPVGRVGQEIYGCGGAFVLAARCFKSLPGLPFRIWADYPFRLAAKGNVTHIILIGPPDCTARLRVVPKHKDRFLHAVLSSETLQGPVALKRIGDGEDEYSVPAHGEYTLSWRAEPATAEPA